MDYKIDQSLSFSLNLKNRIPHHITTPSCSLIHSSTTMPTSKTMAMAAGRKHLLTSTVSRRTHAAHALRRKGSALPFRHGIEHALCHVCVIPAPAPRVVVSQQGNRTGRLGLYHIGVLQDFMYLNPEVTRRRDGV